ncbi:chalcone isomerase family protein [Pseudoalteromonas sp. SSMSWG5]|uniref:chalcone isomerase family protein n=1 Tax=Pseudoalteromonas sp. SSMSWG5 TaxID=3139396 RepID=UPI0025F890C0|nr:chalcone isomerase family protein [uncultured Pseudoalteromonas sp.]|tara:strand:+ start:4971 stop:5468 length:498 start_codon:yes stop_codon:yes gene_type:complete
MKQFMTIAAFMCSLFMADVAANGFKTVGQAKMEYLFWDVYNAKLETPNGTYTFGQHPSKLTLTYLRDFKAKDIVKATNEQWQHLGLDEMVGAYDKQLLDLWPDISKNDSLTFQTNEQAIGTFYFNGKPLGQINDDKFADNFLAIWLSAGTSEPSLRKQLIGGKHD